MSDQFAILKRANVVRSRTNPRTVFDVAYIQDLSNSIKDHGVIQAILVRPLPAARVPDTPRNVTHEIVCGECRDRASEIAGVDEYPVMIKDLTDDQVLEIQLVENLKRRDLSELEEAQGYDTLMQHAHLNADQVAAKIGKSRAYVYGRLKLLDLSQECKQALREGKIKPSHAVLIARIPDAKLQTKALAEATRPITASGDQFISERAFQSWLQANVMLRLDAATFAITDTRLLKDAGSCKDCPKRTGANPDLFAEVNSADLCTDPACYHGKADAHRTAMIAKAEAKGLRLVEGKEAKEICKPNTSKLDGYLPLSQLRQDAIHMIPDGSNKVPTLRDLLGKDAPDPVLIEHPVTKELIEAVPTAETEALLITRGLIKATQQQAKVQADAESEIEYLQKALKAKTNTRTQAAVQTYIKDCVRGLDKSEALKLLNGDVLRAWFIGRLDRDLDPNDLADLVGYKFSDGADEMDSICMHIRACPAGTLIQAMVLDMIDSDSDSDLDDGLLKALERTLQVNTVPIAKRAAATVKAEIASQIKALQAQLRTTTAQSVTTPADTSYKGEGGEPKTNKPAAKQPAPRKSKLTPEQALSGIAAAMQGDDDQATTASPDVDAETALYDEAVALVLKDGKPSISLVQRHLKIGYNSAARLLDQMERNGVVSAMNSSGTRAVIGIQKVAEDAFEVGLRVRVTQDDNKLGLIARKWSGKEGTITRREEGGGFWDVTFKGRGGGVAMFAEDQLEGVAC